MRTGDSRSYRLPETYTRELARGWQEQIPSALRPKIAHVAELPQKIFKRGFQLLIISSIGVFTHCHFWAGDCMRRVAGFVAFATLSIFATVLAVVHRNHRRLALSPDFRITQLRQAEQHILGHKLSLKEISEKYKRLVERGTITRYAINYWLRADIDCIAVGSLSPTAFRRRHSIELLSEYLDTENLERLARAITSFLFEEQHVDPDQVWACMDPRVEPVYQKALLAWKQRPAKLKLRKVEQKIRDVTQELKPLCLAADRSLIELAVMERRAREHLSQAREFAHAVAHDRPLPLNCKSAGDASVKGFITMIALNIWGVNPLISIFLGGFGTGFTSFFIKEYLFGRGTPVLYGDRRLQAKWVSIYKQCRAIAPINKRYKKLLVKHARLKAALS